MKIVSVSTAIIALRKRNRFPEKERLIIIKEAAVFVPLMVKEIMNRDKKAAIK